MTAVLGCTSRPWPGLIGALALAALLSANARAQGSLDQRIADLAQQIDTAMTQQRKTAIAVVEFSDLQGNVTDFGRFLAEELITRLHATRKFRVIERLLLNRIIAEQRLSLSGLVDPNSAKQLGRLLSVDAIASGTIAELAQSLRVNARLISTETGEIFAVAAVEIFKDESVMRLMASGAITASAASGAGTTVARRKTEFTDKMVELAFGYDPPLLRVRLVSVEVLEQGRLRINMLADNLCTCKLPFLLDSPEDKHWVIDQTGQPHPFREATGLSSVRGELNLGANSVPFSVIFGDIPPAIAKLNRVHIQVRGIHNREGNIDWQNINLR